LHRAGIEEVGKAILYYAFSAIISFAAYIKSEIMKWAKVAKDSGARID
jgi:hypothetical protein